MTNECFAKALFVRQPNRQKPGTSLRAYSLKYDLLQQ